jgi:hypothetical protein
MQIVQPVLTRNYYQVLVEPRKTGEEVKFISAFTLNDQQWCDAMRMKSIPPPHRKREAGAPGSPAS